MKTIFSHQQRATPFLSRQDSKDRSKIIKSTIHEVCRSHEAIPVIDYNPRSEKLITPALKEKGDNQNGWPYAPYRMVPRANSFDFSYQRASFSCRTQCVSSTDPELVASARECRYWMNYHGFTKHMSIRHPPGSLPRSSGTPTGIGNSKPGGLPQREPIPPTRMTPISLSRPRFGALNELVSLPR